MHIAPKLDVVRVGFIGIGSRSSGHLATMLLIDGVEVTALCDNHKPSLDAAVKKCVDAGRPAPPAFEDYRLLLDRQDVDIVIIATPWEFHVPMAVAAMKSGKHAFIEVPASTTVEGCWELVETAEQTKMHCMMMENVNYGREELMVLNMCRQGVFGELLHGEAAYIHDLRWQMKEIEHGTGSWRTYEYTKRNGNLYPTHGLGPVAQYMNINRGDRLDYLSSVSSPARMREIYAEEHFPEGHERRSLGFVCGDINTTIVKTVLGRTMMIQWDEQLPRPYSRHNLIQGTRGIWAGFPNRCALEPPPLARMVRAGEEEGAGGGGSGSSSRERGQGVRGSGSLSMEREQGVRGSGAEKWLQGSDLDAIYEKYDHPLWKRLAKEAEEHGGHGGMDFVMLWRIVYCLRNGEQFDQDVYDAATWSVVGPLSEESVANRGKSVDVPDFTRGKWKTMQPLGIVS